MLKKMLLLIAIAILCIIPASPAAAEKGTQIRFGHFAFGTPEVNILVDGVVVNTTTSPTIVNPFKISARYVDLTAGVAHTFAVVPVGKTLEAALFTPKEFTLTDGHQYTLAMIGNEAANDLHFALFDETATIAEYDTSISAVSIVINNLYGVPAVDFYWAGKLMIDSLAYGDTFVGQDLTVGIGSKTTPHGDAKTAIFDFPGALPGPANCLAYFVFVGTYPGETWIDYSAVYLGTYLGKVTVKDGGAMAVGDVRTVKFTALGERMQYQFVLDKETTLDMSMVGGQSAPGISRSDAVLRIYDAQDEMIVESDDGADVDIKGLTLSAGTYRLEAASFADSFPGDYTLAVTASK